MKRLRRVLYRLIASSLALPLLAGCGAGGGITLPTPPVPTGTPVPLASFQRGMAYVSYKRGEFASGESDATITDRLLPLGANWLAVVVTCYQQEAAATQIECPADASISDDDVTHVIQYAHSLGMKVMLKPQVNLRDASVWRGTITPGGGEDGWRSWFASYTTFITHYASIARYAGADYFVVGTELAGTSQRTDDWRAVVQRVRAFYGGPLTYAANHSGEETNIRWWDAVDAIGVDAYYPLTGRDDPAVSDLTAAWAPVVTALEHLSKQWNRPIILTEVGYQSAKGANRTPWGVNGTPVDLQLQADCYQAVFNAFAGRPWWLGIYWWAVTPSRGQGGANDTDFTPIAKPAAEVVRVNYGGTHRPTPSASP